MTKVKLLSIVGINGIACLSEPDKSAPHYDTSFPQDPF
jgi:hypothetical protein